MNNHLLVGVLAVVLASCGGSSASDAASPPVDAESSSSCPDGVRPALDDCAHGSSFAECGGAGAPRFGCDELYGSCLWFTGGCVATGFHESTCPGDDLCCVDNARGTWPFADGWAPSDPRWAASLIEEVGSFARAGAVTRDVPASLEVQLDATLGAPDAVAVECSGDVAYEICAGALRTHANGESLVITIPSVLPPRSVGLELEVVRGSDGELIARTFPRGAADTEPMGEPSCEQASVHAAPPSDVTGTLVLSAFDVVAVESIHGEAHLSIGASGTAIIRF